MMCFWVFFNEFHFLTFYLFEILLVDVFKDSPTSEIWESATKKQTDPKTTNCIDRLQYVVRKSNPKFKQ